MIDLHNSLQKIIQQLAPHYHHFDDGRINYTDSTIFLYVQSIITHHDKILLLQRSPLVHYPLQRSGCSGFYDHDIDPYTLLGQEISEELGQDHSMFTLIKNTRTTEYLTKTKQIGIGETYYLQASHEFTPILNREHQDWCWVTIDQLHQFDLIPGYHSNIIQSSH